REQDIDKFSHAIFWFVKAFLAFMIRRRKFFARGKGIVIIHGDTLSTLLGLLVSRFFGMKVVHIESGLRSRSLLNPFPEEIIRILACRFSHYLFAPSHAAYENLKGYKALQFNSEGNTIFDAISFVDDMGRPPLIDIPYCVCTIHRSELLLREDHLRIALFALYQAASFIKVIFVVHKATLKRLRALGELDVMKKNQNIILREYYDYPSFMALVKNADFVMTDGGGLQEETFLLNIPCLILRKRTERDYGLNSTALLSEMKKERIDYFLKNYRTFHRRDYKRPHPSRLIVEKLSDLL
ncbi:MAG: UDP-N-acetylglucosamine 2-epimerase, partial [Deltaproteobacteria bacterium]|nr:UDP-N-acetylglucosamine 2-epimerase [Deltaproteobacteria bacterium]